MVLREILRRLVSEIDLDGDEVERGRLAGYDQPGGDDELRHLAGENGRLGRQHVLEPCRVAVDAKDDDGGVVEDAVITHEALEPLAERGARPYRIVEHVECPRTDLLGDVDPERIVAAATHRLVPQGQRGDMRNASLRVVDRGGIDARRGEHGAGVYPEPAQPLEHRAHRPDRDGYGPLLAHRVKASGTNGHCQGRLGARRLAPCATYHESRFWFCFPWGYSRVRRPPRASSPRCCGGVSTRR